MHERTIAVHTYFTGLAEQGVQGDNCITDFCRIRSKLVQSTALVLLLDPPAQIFIPSTGSDIHIIKVHSYVLNLCQSSRCILHLQTVLDSCQRGGYQKTTSESVKFIYSEKAIRIWKKISKFFYAIKQCKINTFSNFKLSLRILKYISASLRS